MNEDLLKKFDELDRVLKVKAPSLYGKLSPGAGSSELIQLREGLHLETGSLLELEAWFSWHNGASGAPVQLLPLGYSISISETLADRKLTNSISGVDKFRKNAVKILEDGSGDGFFLDVSSPEPKVYYHMLQNPRPECYGDLRQFIDFLIDAFWSGVVFVNSAGDFDYDEALYDSMERGHLERTIRGHVEPE